MGVTVCVETMIEYELFKISTSEDDDEDRERPLTPEEWKELQRMAMEDMDHIQYPQIPHEDIPKQNLSVPDAFEDAFPDDDDDSAVQKLYKAYALNKRINIKDQQRGAPGLGIHPQDIAARRSDAKQLQQQKFRSNKDANINMDMARDMQSGNFISVDPNDTTKVVPQTRAFPKESYIPRSKKFGEKLIETENTMIRSRRDQGPDVMITDSNFKPKPTDTMSKPSMSSQTWRHRDMQNRPEDRGDWTRDTQTPNLMPGGRQMKWQSTSDLVNTAMGRPKGTSTVQQGKMNIAPTGYKPQTQTPLKGAQWKGTANKKAAASTYTPGIKSASQLET